MYKKSISFLSIVMLTFIISSCNRCRNVFPPVDYFELKIEDLNGNNLLGTTYNQVAFKLYNSNSEIWLNYNPISQGEILRIKYEDILSNAEYYLELSPSEIDTIKVNFSQTREKCYNTFKPELFVYNGNEFTSNNSVTYKISK